MTSIQSLLRICKQQKECYQCAKKDMAELDQSCLPEETSYKFSATFDQVTGAPNVVCSEYPEKSRLFSQKNWNIFSFEYFFIKIFFCQNILSSEVSIFLSKFYEEIFFKMFFRKPSRNL
jgi:hypothetical protein